MGEEATPNADSAPIEFVRESEHQRDFDGRWQVWRGTRYFGIVRRSSDAIRKSEAWGFESVPFGPYPKGQRCEAGFCTRGDAAWSLVRRIETGQIDGPVQEKNP